jgi:uncharacterized membrane protein YfcA
VDLLTVHVLAVVFLATLIRSTFGFGEALVAVPLLALRIPVNVAVPLAVLLSITVAAVVVAQDWQHIHLRSAGGLILSTLAGIPLGLLLLLTADERVVKGILALVIGVFSGYCLLRKAPLELRRESRRWLFGFGFCAGVLGGAYGMNGPPLVVYGSLRRWSPAQFRATLQGYFLPASLIGMAGYWLAGLWVPAVTRYYLYCLPLVLIAIFLGRAVNRRLGGRSFQVYLHLLLILISLVLLLQASGV